MRPRILHSSAGFTYIAALVMVVIMGILLGRAAGYWKTRMQQEREVELLYRGTQYRNAMRSFYGMPVDETAVPQIPVGANQTPGAAQAPGAAAQAQGGVAGSLVLPTTLPTTLPNGQLVDLKGLLQSTATASKKRFLRKLFLDPITGKEFDVVRDGNQQIIGVKSSSEAEPLKQANFPIDLEPTDFEGKKKYSDWQFICIHYPLPASAGGVQGLGGTSTPGQPTGQGGTTTGQPSGQGQPNTPSNQNQTSPAPR